MSGTPIPAASSSPWRRRRRSTGSACPGPRTPPPRPPPTPPRPAQAPPSLASAPKSNRAGLAYWAAMADVLDRGSLPVPLHLRNAPARGMRTHGIGVGYRYPHDYDGADVAQQYLPDGLSERRYYTPSGEGLEARS